MNPCAGKVGEVVCAIAAEAERGLCWSWVHLSVAWSLVDWFPPWQWTCQVRVIVCGSRGYGRADVIRARVRELPQDALVIVGRARGADTVAEREALACGLDVAGYPAEWSKHGRRAGWLRNRVMLDALQGGAHDEARLVIAFYDGRSRGTAGMMELARRAGIHVEVWNADGVRTT